MCFVDFDFEMHFLHILTSKSAPKLVCFVDFDFEMCFTPQCRANFQHRNFQKCSEPITLLTSKCASRHNGVHFLHILTSKNHPSPSALTLLTSKCASRNNGVRFFSISTSKSAPNPSILTLLTSPRALRHNDVQFFISHLATWLRTRRFSEPTFRPFRATNH